MKKTLLFIIAGIMFSGLFAADKNQLKSFEEIMEVLKLGKEVKVVIHYADCELISDNEIQERVPNAIGGMAIETWEYFAQNAVRNKLAFVVTSTNHLIKNPIGEGYVYNYVKLKIDEENKVKVTARYLEPGNFKQVMDENFFGKINDGSNDGQVFFYLTEN